MQEIMEFWIYKYDPNKIGVFSNLYKLEISSLDNVKFFRRARSFGKSGVLTVSRI